MHIEQQLHLNQTDILSSNSLEPRTNDNSINIAEEERFARFKSDILNILAQNRNQGEKLSNQIFNNNSHASNLSLNSQSSDVKTEVYSISERKGITQISVDYVEKDSNDNIHLQEGAISPNHLESPHSNSSDSILRVSQPHSFLSNNIDLSHNLKNISDCKNFIESLENIATFDLKSEIISESIFFSQNVLDSFIPFPNRWSRLKSKFYLEFTELNLHRNEFRSLLLQQLSNNGILAFHKGVSLSQFNFLMNNAQTIQEKYSTLKPLFYSVRRILEKDLLTLIEGTFEFKLSTLKELPTYFLDSLLKVNKPNIPIDSETPVISEFPKKYKSDTHTSHTSPVIEVENSKFSVGFVRKNLQNTSWDSDNSELEQDYDNLLSEFTGKYSALSNSLYSEHGPNINQYNEYVFLSGSIPSDFSLSDVTAEIIENTENMETNAGK